MIKFSRTAANQSVSAADSPILTLPNGDWCIGFIVGFDGLVSGDNPQYLISTGSYGGAGSFNVLYNTLGAAAGSAYYGRMSVYADNATATVPPLLTTTNISTGYHLYIVQRSSGVVTVRRCEITSSAKSANDVIADGSSTSSVFLKELNGAGLKIGSRFDDTANRKADQSISRVFMLASTLTESEIARLANGEEITAIGKTPVWYTRMSDVSDVADRGPNNLAFTVNGSPTTSAEPPFSGAAEQPVTNTVDVIAPTANRIYQRFSGSASIPLSGSYVGVIPTSIEYQLYAADGVTVAKAWAEIPSAVITGGSWSGTVQIPEGGKYQLEVQSKNSSNVLAVSGVKANQFGVGDIVASIGSSSAEHLFTIDSGTAFTPDARTSKLSGATPSWAAMTATGAATSMASNLSAKAGVPIGMLNYGKAGTSLAEWLDKNNSVWKNFSAGVAAAGGKLALAYISVGSNDANAGMIASRAAHLANMRALVANVRELTGQPNLPILWSGSNRRDSLNAMQADYLRMAEVDIGSDPNVWHMQTTDFTQSADKIHLSSTGNGYPASAIRAAYVAGEAMYSSSYLRGPKITKMEGKGNLVTVTLQHQGSNDFSPTSGITGFTGTGVDDQPLSLSAAKSSPNQITITADRPAKTIKYQSGPSPSVTSAVFGNTAQALPMLVETDLAVISEPEGGTEQPTNTIDATKIPSERRVVFEGSKRVVSFEGNIRKVVF